MVEAVEAARIFSAYAKKYHAGAFATPTRKELEADPSRVIVWPDGALVANQVLQRDSSRKDFVGNEFVIPVGSRIATHVAHSGWLPPLDDYDYVMAYQEDSILTTELQLQGFNRFFTRVTSASELITCWHRGSATVYPAWDDTTVTELPVPWGDYQEDIALEVRALNGYADDVPLYSDGSWGALTLRGYYPDDPGRNAKPAEQDRKWKAAHPEDLELPCVWTKLALDCLSTCAWVDSIPWWRQLERVRLLRMTRGKLARHTDILDRAGGTRDGEIVRFHIPIVTHPDIQLHTVDLGGKASSTHLEPWKCYYLDTRLPHAVTNPTDVERIHLVVDVVSSPEVRDRIATGSRLA